MKDSDLGQHFGLLNFGPVWSNYCTVFGAAAALERSDLELEPEPVVLLLLATATWPEISVRSLAREERCVMFEWNVQLDLSGGAATKTFCSLMTELLLQVLCKSTGTMTVWVIRGGEGVGDIPGVCGVFRGVCRFFAILDSIDTRTQT